jgi:hypothetical protein
MVTTFVGLLSSRTISGVKWVQSNVSYKYNSSTHQIWVKDFALFLAFYVCSAWDPYLVGDPSNNSIFLSFFL